MLLYLMRISCYFFLLVAITTQLLYANPSHGQLLKKTKLDLHVQNKSLKVVLSDIQRTTGVRFVYDNNLVSSYNHIHINVKNSTLEEVLRNIQKQAAIDYVEQEQFIVLLPASAEKKTIRMPKHAVQDQVTVKGIVSDEAGTPLSGVTVKMLRGAGGTSTNENGQFSLLVDPTDSLDFSMIGYHAQRLPIGSRRDFMLHLIQTEGQGLDEVVVVGMNFRQSKRAVTGAMATIQTKELKQSPVANLNNALAGRLPGLITVQSSGKPGEDAAAMYLRGIATYGSNTAPLIVIDGLPRGSGSFSQIDPNEVESVSILKDASSSALYGIQGANGVIVVTTKRGRVSQKPVIDFTAQTALQQVTRLPQPISTYESALYFNDYDRNNNTEPRFSDEALQIVQAGSEPYLYPDVNWFDEILNKNAWQNQYNLNISGSSNRVRYFVSGSHIKQGSLLKHSDLFYDNYGKKSGFSRYNFRSNIDIEATSRLQVQVDLAGRLEKRVGPMPSFEEVFTQINNMPPFALPVFNPDGSLGAASNVEIPYWRNPYGLVTQSGYYENSTNVMYGTISAKHELDFITPGLSAQAFFSFENNNFNRTTRSQEFDAYWYRGLDGEGLPIYQQTRIASTIATSGYNNIERSSYLDARINYTKGWSEHLLTAQILANRTLRVLDYELPYAYQGISGRFTYNYAARYFLEANLSYNGSENFPSDKRYGFFPSASLGWIVNDESFLKNVQWLNLLKIRGSIGLVGNDKIGGQRWLYLSDFAAGDGYEFGVNKTWRPGYNEARVGNPYVTWEHARKANLGFEISVLPNDLLQLTVDVFHEKRSDILTNPGKVPDYLGIASLAPLNVGVVTNRGLDGELRINKRWRDFGFFSNIQFTYARNKVVQNDQPNPAYPYQDLRNYEVGYVLGYKAIGFFASQEDIDKSPKQSFDNSTIPGDIKYQDINEDGVINAFDRVPIKIQNVPRFTGGISLGASYKSIDVSVLLNGSAGGAARYVPKPLDPIITQRWTPENQEHARVPVAKNSSNNTLVSDFYVFKTDYLKLRNAEIGFVVPGNWLKQRGIDYLRVFLNGQNLAIWDKLWIKDRDPEVSGTSDLPYPIQRVFNLGVNIKL